jgi:hypothetical protein
MSKMKVSQVRSIATAPDTGDYLLLYCEDRDWAVGFRSGGRWVDRSGKVELSPSHWAPLPPEPGSAHAEPGAAQSSDEPRIGSH